MSNKQVKAPVEAPRTYTKEQVLSRFGVCYRTIQRWVDKRGFPKPRQITEAVTLFLADDVDAWLMKRLELKEAACR